jgi:hypothetical protein
MPTAGGGGTTVVMGTVLPPIPAAEVSTAPVVPVVRAPVVPAVRAPVVPAVNGEDEDVAPEPPVPVIGTERSTMLGTWEDIPPPVADGELLTPPGSEICPLAQAPSVITEQRKTVDSFRIGLG